MKTNFALDRENMCDASLVELSLTGDREAFGEIVSRYQSTICALAYSASGNVARSEDLAQEVFITAWRKLSSLREPARFKSWLYGIARHLIQNAYRQHQRNPVAEAEVLEDATSVAPSGGGPDEQAISKEEETILWHVLSGLPEVYREPMVLFYRQNESMPAVAEALSISEEAVRQRLSRGRALLNERVARVVQNGLRRSGPSNTFAVAVVAGLPALAAATTAKGALMGMATTQSSETAGVVGALKSLGFFAGIVAIPAIVGSYFGQKLGGDSAGSVQRRKAAAKFWRLFTRGMILLLFIPLLLTFGLARFFHGEARDNFLSVMTVWLGLAYPFAPAALVYWAWQRRRKSTRASTPDGQVEADTKVPAGFFRRNARRLVLLMTIGAGSLLVFCYLDMGHNIQRVNAQGIRDVIEKNAPQDLRASVSVYHFRSHFRESPETFRSLSVEVSDGGKKTRYWGPVTDDAISLLAKKGVNCPVYIQGRDFEVLGTPGRFLPFLTAFVLAIGGIFMLKQRRVAAEAVR